jgi:hypothetical protein
VRHDQDPRRGPAAAPLARSDFPRHGPGPWHAVPVTAGNPTRREVPSGSLSERQVGLSGSGPLKVSALQLEVATARAVAWPAQSCPAPADGPP